MRCKCLLSGVKRTCLFALQMSALDPELPLSTREDCSLFLLVLVLLNFAPRKALAQNLQCRMVWVTPWRSANDEAHLPMTFRTTKKMVAKTTIMNSIINGQIHQNCQP